MQKIKSLFKRDYEGTRYAYNEVVEGSEWVLAGEGIPTFKWDGTSCMIRHGQLYKRYDRKLTKSANRKKRQYKSFIPSIKDFKPCPDGWFAAEETPNQHTGHWPGWLLIDKNDPANKYHVEGMNDILPDGTYELIGEKVQRNPHNIVGHKLVPHGVEGFDDIPPRTFEGLKLWLRDHIIEGIVWHHEDGRMVKIKRSDFGYEWPIL